MDKRKLRFKRALHQNLNPVTSQVPTTDSTILEGDPTSKESISRKRKLPVSVISQSRSENRLDLCPSQNESRKRRRQHVNLTRKTDGNSHNENSSKLIDATSRQLLFDARDTTVKAREVSNVLRRSNDRIVSNKKNENIHESVTKLQETQREANLFQNFLKVCGIVSLPDGTYVFDQEATRIKQTMKEKLQSMEYKKEQVIKSLEEYVEDRQNLQCILSDVQTSHDYQSFDHINDTCVVRILLQISELQPDIQVYLLNKLNESVLLADTMDEIPWARMLLQKFRFLEIIVEPDTLTKSLEQLLETCPLWFQRELIPCIPDIVTEMQHQAIAEILDKAMDDNTELADVVLDCINNLMLGREYLNDYKNKVLDMLNKHLKTNVIPAVTKFVLGDCTTVDTCKRIVHVIRNIDMQPLHGERIEDCYKSQMITIKNIKMCILLSKDMVCAVLGVIKKIVKDPKPMDIVLLLLISSTGSTKKKSVTVILKQHVRSGFYRLSLLQLLYKNYREVVRDLQPSIIQLASNMLKAEEKVYVDFAIEWFRLQFLSQKDTVHKQREIIERIILLMGNNDHTAKNALSVLCKMATGTEERQYLYAHCNHLRILLEKMDNFGIKEVGTLNDLLHGLCTNVLAESLRDDLFIVLQKQLSAIKPLVKCKGVLGAVMAIKHLACKTDGHISARNLFKKVLTAVKSCPRSQALFYDQLAEVIAQTRHIREEFLRYVTVYIQDEFIDAYMIDRSEYNGNLMPRFGLGNVQYESQNSVLNFSDRKYGAIVPISLRLLKTCCMQVSENGGLEDIDALLGCPILMPENLDDPEPFVADLVICCINWFREVISGFVTQSQSLLQEQVLMRLNDLMYLQGELHTMISLLDSNYQPQPCYFHYFPPPPFLKVERTVKKKGKKKKSEKTVNIPDQECWEMGSTLCFRNPAYFRKLDAKIINLLDYKLDLHASPTTQSISIRQVCFVVKELLGMCESDLNEAFMRDVVHLLPKICGKLQEIVSRLRENDIDQDREGARLILCLLTTVFNWKEFNSAIYNPMLHEGLRTLSSQQNNSNAMLRSCKELVTESCKYIESLSDIATRISMSVTLINMYQSVMKHSETYMQQHRNRNAKMALGFLSLEWPEDKHCGTSYKAAVYTLVKSWLDHESSPLDTITTLLEWLPNEVAKLGKSQDRLDRLPSITRNNFHLLYKKVFDGMTKGVKVSLSLAKRDPERVDIWLKVVTNVQRMVQICKTLNTKSNILIFLRCMPILLRLFLNSGIPILEYNLKYQSAEITKLVKLTQVGTRYLHAICCDGMQKKDTILTKHIPAAKSVLERLVYGVKGMLVLNNSSAAFWMGNLLNKNLEGQEVLSQASSSEETTLPSIDTIPYEASNVSSEILDSDSDDELMGDHAEDEDKRKREIRDKPNKMIEQDIEGDQGGLRIDGRRPLELRQIHVRMGVFGQADGSAYVEHGKTKILATVYGPHQPRSAGRGSSKSSKGVVNCQYSMAVFSSTSGERKRKPRGDRKSQERSLELRRAMEAIIHLELYPRSQIDVFVEVLQMDGSDYCASVNAATLALIDAGIPIKNYAIGCTVTLANSSYMDGEEGGGGGAGVLDANFIEECAPGVTLSIVALPETSNVDATKNLGLIVVAQGAGQRLHLSYLESLKRRALLGCQDIKTILDRAVRYHLTIHSLPSLCNVTLD